MIWSFYSVETGLFSGKRFAGSLRLIESNTPRGFAAIQGMFDRTAQRLDVDAMAKAEPGDYSSAADFVVDYRRPAEEVLAEQRARRDEEARRALKEIDLAMVRPLVQLLKDPQHTVARAALDELEAAAAAVRVDVVPTENELDRATRLRP